MKIAVDTINREETDPWEILRQQLPAYADWGTGLPCVPFQLPGNLKFYIRDSVTYMTTRQIMAPYYLFVFTISGEQHLQVDDKEIIVRPGEFLVLLPFMRHNFFTSPDFPARTLFISCQWEDSEGRLKPICGTPLKLYKQEIRDLQSCSLLGGMAFQNDARYGQECVLAFTLFLFKLIHRRSPDILPETLQKNALPRKKELMRQIIMLIHEKSNAKLTIGEIAKTLHLSEIRIRQIFKEEMKCSIGRYIRVQALSTALFLAKSTGLSFAEIAQRVGYTNSGAMETAMRRETGKTLRMIREENQN